MASSKDRERKLARAKIERQRARRAERTRRKRAVQARVAAGVSLLLVFVLVSWSFDWYGLFTHHEKLDASGCVWRTDGVANADTKETGTPPALTEKTTGTRDMTITLNSGEVDVELDATAAPCSTESFAFLAGRSFFNDTTCHRVTTEGIYILQCGDPSGTGAGGPSYQYDDENLPVDFKPASSASASPSTSAPPSPNASSSASASPSAPPTDTPPSTTVIYPAGTIAMANSGPDTNGSQFFIVYKDSPFTPDYTVIGKVTKGLDVIAKIAKDGVQEVGGAAQTDGAPVDTVTIQALTVINPALGPVGSPSASAPSSPAPSTEPSPDASASTKS